MKFDIIIKDVTEDEISHVISKLTSLTATASVQPAVIETEDEEGTVADTNTRDADNLPWDARIHSSNKKIGKDGKWSKRRGRTDEEYNSVKIQLLGSSVTPAVTMQAPQFTPPAAPPVAQPQFTPPAAPPQFTQNTLQSIVQRIQAGIAQQKFDTNKLVEMTQNISSQFQTPLTQIIDIPANNQQMLDYAALLLSQHGV